MHIGLSDVFVEDILAKLIRSNPCRLEEGVPCWTLVSVGLLDVHILVVHLVVV